MGVVITARARWAKRKEIERRYWRAKLNLGIGVSGIAVGIAGVGSAIYLLTKKYECGTVTCAGNELALKLGGALLATIGAGFVITGLVATILGAVGYRRWGAALRRLRLQPRVLIDPLSHSYGLSVGGRF